MDHRKPEPDCMYCDRGKPARAHGMCSGCYQRNKTYGSPYIRQRQHQPEECEVPTCHARARAHSKCFAHNKRSLRHNGEVFANVPIGAARKLR
jgi:hypothetical protein